MDDAKVRAWWSHRQGLDGRLAGEPAAAVLEQTGWARSVGGAAPYLGLFARCGVSRETVDAGLADLALHELPSARGCTYVVPAADFALALKVGQGFRDAEVKVARGLGVTDAEIDKLCGAVVKALEKGALEPEELRQATGGAVRNLGEAGKKKGVSTTLTVALGALQAAGEIRRVPTNGRIDQQRYRYALWRPHPLAGCKLTAEEAYAELARRYFAWIGPATLTEFQWFSGLGVKAARTAVEGLQLAPLEEGGGRLLFPRDREEFRTFRVPRQAQYALISSLDGISHLRRDVKGLVAPEDSKRVVSGEKGSRELGGVSDLPSHAIVDRGRLVGLWEYDPATESIAWMTFGPANQEVKEAVRRMEEFVRVQLGDARSFSLDSPKSRAPRIEALRRGNRTADERR